MALLRNGENRIAYRYIKKNSSSSINPFILLHHGTGCMNNWSYIETEISNKFESEVYSYDRVGFGMSQPSISTWTSQYHIEGALELLEFMDYIDCEKANLIGHSDGATIALLCADLKPERVNAIVCEAPHVFHGSRYETIYGHDGGFEYFNKHVMKKHEDRLRVAFQRDHGERGEEVLNRWYEWWTDPLNMTWDCSEVLSSIQCPTLCIHGENDVFYPEEHTRFISDSLVRGEYSLMRNCGHEIHKDNPDEFLDKTCIFFSKVLARDCCVD